MTGPEPSGVSATALHVVLQHLESACPSCPPGAAPDACEVLAWARLTAAVAAVPSEPKL